MTKKAVLLLNLGSPDSTDVADVRKYLAEFLWDERVLDAPAPIRWLVLNLFILPFRPKRSAEAYSNVWKPEGSPLVITSGEQQKLLEQQSGLPVYLGMRYGNPSIPSVITKIREDGITDLFIMPLYPHYAMSSYETVVVRTTEEIAEHHPNLRWEVLQPFYQDEDYIDALVESARPYLDRNPDYFLFSYHGIPVRHLRKSDPSKAHCVCVKDCCNVPSAVQSTCYRHQCMRTTALFAAKAGLDPAKYSVSFQSRLAGEPWLTPYTDKELERLAKEGKKNIQVICPAFISDCLETLEEIAMEGAETFHEAGGESLTQVPCLNTHPAWINVMSNRVANWAESTAQTATAT